jgi:ankyrin repeat protein
MPENKDDIDLEGWDLHRAAKENRSDIARSLIARGDDIEAKDDDGWTALNRAASCNSLDVARLLIEKGAEVDARDGNGSTPLRRAAFTTPSTWPAC